MTRSSHILGGAAGGEEPGVVGAFGDLAVEEGPGPFAVAPPRLHLGRGGEDACFGPPEFIATATSTGLVPL